MELTLRAILVLIVLLVAAIIFATLILGWGNQANLWFGNTFDSLRNWILGG
jgi:hypothetical protein